MASARRGGFSPPNTSPLTENENTPWALFPPSTSSIGWRQNVQDRRDRETASRHSNAV